MTDASTEASTDLRHLADAGSGPVSPDRPTPALLTEAAPILCVRSLSENDHMRPVSDEVKSFSHESRRESKGSNASGQDLAGWLEEQEEPRRNSKRFHTVPMEASGQDAVDTFEGLGDLDDDDVEAAEVEQYQIKLTPPVVVKEEEEGQEPKLPWTMAKLESLNERKKCQEAELPTLVRTQSVKSLLSNLQAIAEELSASKLEADASLPSSPKSREETAETSGKFALLVKSALSMDQKGVEELVDAGVSVNMALREEQHGTVNFSTVLHAVCDLATLPDGQPQRECIAIVKTLLAAKANINPRNSKGLTPLMCACRQKNIEVVKLLISHSARVNPCDERGHSCLNWAAALREEATPLQSSQPRQPFPDDEERSSYLVELLLVASVQEQKRERRSQALTHATSKRRASLTAKVEDQDDLTIYSNALTNRVPKAFPPLRMAVMQQNVSAALVMMACGAAPIWLHDAVRVGSLDLVHALIHFNADPAKQDSNGASSIDTAVQICADMQIVEVLRENVHLSTAPRKMSECSVNPSAPVRRISVASALSIRSLGIKQRSPSSRSFVRMISPKNGTEMRSTVSSWQSVSPARWSEHFDCLAIRSRKIFESNKFQGVMFIMLTLALYLPDVYVLTDSGGTTLDVLLAVIFVFFAVDALLQVVGIGKAYIFSFFFVMDVIGTLSLIVEFSAVKESMQGNSLTQNSVVMRATRASKLGARAGRLTRLVKLMRFLPFLRNKKMKTGDNGTAKVIAARLIGRVSSIVACLIILSVQVLPLPESLSMPDQDFSIPMWTQHLRSAIEVEDEAVVNDLVGEIRAFYDRKTTYQPYAFMNGTEVLWQVRGPVLDYQSMRIEDGAAVILFDFSQQVQLESGMNMIVITLTILLMVVFSLLISKAVQSHALTPLEVLLLKVRKIGRLIWLQVQSLQSQFGNDTGKGAVNDFQDADETVLLRDVLSKIGLLSAIKLMRPDADAEALAFLGTGAVVESPVVGGQRETLAVRLQTVIQEDLESLEVENITTWRFNPLDFEDPSTAPFVCAKLLSSCVPIALKARGVTEMEISAFSETCQAGYSKTVPYHNWNHAVDTMHSVYVLLQECRDLFSGIEVYTLLMCGAAHDIGHPGFSNEFLVQTKHEFAMRYNDSAPLENMHCARLFEILSEPTTNIVGRLDDVTRKDIRKMSIEAILHTDNSVHFNEVKALQMIHEVHDEDFSQACSRYVPGDESNDWPSEELVAVFKEKDTHDTIRNVILHFADISNSMKPFTIARVWADLVLEEFFLQGDKMKELGLPVPALNDREKTGRPTSQIGFIEFIVSPLVFTIVKILPPIAFSEQAMMGTVKYWFEEWSSSASPSKSEYQQMANRIKGLYEKATFAKQPGALFKRWKSV